MSTEVNSQASQLEKSFQSLLWKPLTDAAVASLFADQPWMAVWPFEPIIRGIIDLFSNALYGKVELAVDLSALKLMNAQAQASYEQASTELLIVSKEKGHDSAEYQQAHDQAVAALAFFVRYRQ